MRLIDLPYGVGAAITIDEDGFANIYINAKLSFEDQKRKLKHELRHYFCGDIENNKTIQEIEIE